MMDNYGDMKVDEMKNTLGRGSKEIHQAYFNMKNYGTVKSPASVAVSKPTAKQPKPAAKNKTIGMVPMSNVKLYKGADGHTYMRVS